MNNCIGYKHVKFTAKIYHKPTYVVMNFFYALIVINTMMIRNFEVIYIYIYDKFKTTVNLPSGNYVT